MKHPYKNVVVFFNGLLLLYTNVSSTIINHENFELDQNLKREQQIYYLSSVLCSIGFKFANIYYEFESKGRFLDGIIGKSSRCVTMSITVIG